jgi:nitrite reductase/ring-hydroxylating ferredoxin subunit
MTAIAMGPAAYTEGEQFQRERRTLFAAEWLVFAASEQMPAPGDFVGHSLGGWPLFAIRDGDGTARAFHNVCRHQSMPVVEQPAGRCDVLRCRYHGWTYGLAGEFREAPPRVAPAEPGTLLGLNPLELSEQDGVCMVRVRPGGEPPPVLAAPAGKFATAIATDIEANWKAAVEALLGGENCRFVWPLAFIAQPEPGSGVIRQLVPRSFSRTRIVDLVFTDDAVAADEIAETVRRRATADKRAAKARQAAHAAGAAGPPSEAVAEFLQKVMGQSSE